MWAYKVEAWDAIPYNMALMTERGVVVSVNSDSDERIRRLYQEAGIGVRYGNMRRERSAQDGHAESGEAARRRQDGRHARSRERRRHRGLLGAIRSRRTAMVEYTMVDGKVYFDRNEATTLRKRSRRGTGGNE